MRRHEYAAAMLALIIGSGAVLLLATREWQTLLTRRTAPYSNDVLGLSGRTIDAAPTALALVALAGVVAVIATKSVVRQAIGALVALAGVLLVWRCASALAAVSPSRAVDLVHEKHPRVVLSAAAPPQVTTHPVWGTLSIAAAVLVLAAGVLIALRGGRWNALSAKYDRPGGAAREIDPEQERARAAASLWSALERGEDPTEHDPRELH